MYHSSILLLFYFTCKFVFSGIFRRLRCRWNRTDWAPIHSEQPGPSVDWPMKSAPTIISTEIFVSVFFSREEVSNNVERREKIESSLSG